MADVISLKDGKVETVFTGQDFEYLIEKYMGYDVVKLFRSFCERHNEEVEELIAEYEEKLDTLKDKYDKLLVELEEKAHDKP